VTRLVFEPLSSWPYPDVGVAGCPFRAKWTGTRQMLLDEAEFLGAQVVVIELDLTPADLRQNGEIRANARLRSGRVRVSLDTRHGPLQYACGRYDGAGWHGVLPWHANARAIALTLQALRAVDRYGAVEGGQQYAGFRALPAGPTPAPFASAEEAMRWMRAQADPGGAAVLDAAAAYRAAARRLHPDTGADPAEWDRLDYARQLLTAAELLP
jgi:hypothetical protein